jgi:hypothetical protein
LAKFEATRSSLPSAFKSAAANPWGVEPLVRARLFAGEAPLTGAVSGTSTFVRDFSAGGPRDHQRAHDTASLLALGACTKAHYCKPGGLSRVVRLRH